MPLAAHFPVLDDRRWSDIVSEAQARIPRYTPEWTDFNPGDPGFALVELFAWMTEMMIFRLNQTPKLSYLKFLELIGIELRPARPATTIVTLPVQPTFASPTVLVSALTQVATAEPDEDGRPIIFETDRTLTAFRAQLSALQSSDGYSFTDLTALNASADQGLLPFGAAPRPDCALMLGFSDTGEFPPAPNSPSRSGRRPRSRNLCPRPVAERRPSWRRLRDWPGNSGPEPNGGRWTWAPMTHWPSAAPASSC